MPEYDFTKVSPTAFGVIYSRGTYSDIPRSKEILTYLSNHGCTLPDLEFSATMKHYSAFFEARYKAIDNALEDLGSTQVLELAAGFSPRGLNFSERGVVYVETDLPETLTTKQELLQATFGNLPQNLKFATANVLNKTELLSACSYFGKAPVAVVNEGLLRYLTHEEKRQLAGNIKDILSIYGGVWITPDIHLKEWAVQRKNTADARQTAERLGRNPEDHNFESFEEARSFFANCGFEVEERPLLQGIRGSVVSLPGASDSLLTELENRRLYLMNAR